MITIESSGSFDKARTWITALSTKDASVDMKQVGTEVVKTLEVNTPVDTGLTAKSWGCEVRSTKGNTTATITNSSENGFNVVQALRNGHGTGTGGWVPANDFVTPIVESIAKAKLDGAARRFVK